MPLGKTLGLIIPQHILAPKLQEQRTTGLQAATALPQPP